MRPAGAARLLLLAALAATSVAANWGPKGAKVGRRTYFGYEAEVLQQAALKAARVWLGLTMVGLVVAIAFFSKAPPLPPKAKQVAMAKLRKGNKVSDDIRSNLKRQAD